jgi:lysophospholipase L1-like esterase
MKPFLIFAFGALLRLLCLPLSAAAAPNSAALHAWYKADNGLQSSGSIVTAWQDSGPAPAGKTLDRVVGTPRLWRVHSAAGPADVLRLDGNSALWQSAIEWGSVAAPRTLLCFARIVNGAKGTFCDSSTPGTSASANLYGAAPGWRVLRFDHRTSRLDGFVLGANGLLNNPLKCDVAEVLVFSRELSPAELEEHTSYLQKKWGNPTDVSPIEQHSESNGFPGLTTRLVCKHGTEGVHSYRMPALASTPSGTLLAVFDQRRHSALDLPADVDVGLLRSTDLGDTWQPMRSILDYDAAAPLARGNGVSSPCILVDRQTGRVFVAALWSHGDRGWNGSGPGLHPEQTGQIVLIHSDDDGLSWSPPRSITSEVKKPEWRLCAQGPGCGAQLRDGTLVFPAYFRESSGAAHACLILSRDHGRSWTASKPAVPDSPPTSEAQVAELADGSVLFSMRDDSRSGRRLWNRFNPADGSWGTPWLGMTDPTSRAALLRCDDGSLVFCNPVNPKVRATLTVRTSWDDGQTWSDGRLVDPRTSNTPSMSILGDGRIAVLYEGDGGLHLARFWPENTNLAAVSQPRQDPNQPPSWWLTRHARKLEQTKKKLPDLLFLGDSLTQGWEGPGARVWKAYYEHRNAANYGYDGDSTQHVLWRLARGELDGLNPKLIVLLVGTSNLDTGKFTPTQIAGGIGAVLESIKQKCPSSNILLLALFPRDMLPGGQLRQQCEAVNALLPPLADGKRVFLLNINHVLLTAEGVLSHNISQDPLHLTPKGYSLWAEAIEPTVQMLLDPAR